MVKTIKLLQQVCHLEMERSPSITVLNPPPSSNLSYKIKSRGASISNITPRPFARMKVDVNKLTIISSILTQSNVDKMNASFLILREL